MPLRKEPGDLWGNMWFVVVLAALMFAGLGARGCRHARERAAKRAAAAAASAPGSGEDPAAPSGGG